MARQKTTEHFTPLELEIMKVLWEHGPADVREVMTRLAADRPLAYTTVQTMLNVLVRKGKAKRTLADRAYRYRPAISREKATATTLRDIVERIFGGSAEALVMSLMETKQLTPETIRRLHEMVSKGRGHE